MQISDIRVRLNSQTESTVKAFVSFSIDDVFVVHDLRIIEHSDGLHVAMPSRKRSNGQYMDIAHPLNKETREMLEEKILDAYAKATAEADAD